MPRKWGFGRTMSFTLREFSKKSSQAADGFTIFYHLGTYVGVPLRADGVAPTEDQMAYYTSSKYAPYVSQQSTTGANATTWIQIDLGQTKPIDGVTLYPAVHMVSPGKQG